jgi:hypothetical protein
MEELGISPEFWFSFDHVLFRQFGGWMLENLDYASLGYWVTMLNNERLITYSDLSRPWARHPLILRISKAYTVLVGRKRVAVATARAMAGLPEDRQRRRRVCPPSETVEEMLCAAEAAIEIWGADSGAILGPVASFLLMMLFAVRASTLGGMKSAEDVSVDANGLSLVIHFLKWWTAGKQSRTHRSLPVTRTGADGVPWGDSDDHPRSRALRIIAAAKERGCLMWMRGGPDKAAAQLSESLARLGWREPNEGTVVTSHSGRKLGVTVGRRVGASAEVMREWMLVLDETTVETYWDREYQVSPFLRRMLDFLRERIE